MLVGKITHLIYKCAHKTRSQYAQMCGINLFINSTINEIITARKRSLQRSCFYTCLSVHGGYPSMPCRWYPSMPCRSPGEYVSQHALQVSRPTPKGELEGSGQGGFSRMTPGGVGSPSPPWGGLQAHAEEVYPSKQTPLADGYCCGWYASYWNVFLLLFYAVVHHVIDGSVESSYFWIFCYIIMSFFTDASTPFYDTVEFPRHQYTGTKKI